MTLTADDGEKAPVVSVSCPSWVDGPGLRTVLTLRGCPLVCPWCHNPDLRQLVSPFEYLTPGQASEKVLATRVWWEDRAGSGRGGVTVTGGEPLVHGGFLLGFASRMRKEGVSLAVQTSLAVEPPELKGLSALVDLWMVDLKVPDPGMYRKATGVSQELLRSNLRILKTGKGNIRPRVVLVPGWMDTPGPMEELGRFCRELDIPDPEFLDFTPVPGFPVKSGTIGPSSQDAGLLKKAFLREFSS